MQGIIGFPPRIRLRENAGVVKSILGWRFRFPNKVYISRANLHVAVFPRSRKSITERVIELCSACFEGESY